MLKNLVIISLLLLLKSQMTYAQELYFDSTLNQIGKVILPQITPNADEMCNNMAINSDGSIILVGNSTLLGRTKGLIVKLKENGGIDSTFGNHGSIIIQATVRDTRIKDVLIQNDGNITIVGECTTGSDYDGKFFLARFTSNGTPDSSFATNGQLLIQIGDYRGEGQSLAIQNDGKYLVAGSTNFTGGKIVPIIIRFTNIGVLDNSFNGSGYNYVNDLTFGNSGANKVLLGTDQKISICGFANVGNGQQYFLYRFTQSGTLDNSFNSTSKRVYNNVTGFEHGIDLTETSNQKILALGWSLSTVYNTDLTLFDLNGSYNSVNFTNGHINLPDTPNFQAKKIANYNNGYLIACDLGNPTYNFKPGLMIVDQTGKLAKTVSDSGIFSSLFEYPEKATHNAIKIQSNNKIVLCGSIQNGSTNSFWVSRILPFSIPNDDTVGTKIHSIKNNELDFSIYPNPIKNKNVTINYKSTMGLRTIIIFDINGKIISKDSQNIIPNNTITETIQLPYSITNGVYFLKLQTNNGEAINQFIIN